MLYHKRAGALQILEEDPRVHESQVVTHINMFRIVLKAGYVHSTHAGNHASIHFLKKGADDEEVVNHFLGGIEMCFCTKCRKRVVKYIFRNQDSKFTREWKSAWEAHTKGSDND